MLLTGASSAWACSRVPGTPEPTAKELVDNAATVVVAHLIKVEEAGTSDEVGWNVELIEGTFRPIELLKGELPAENKVRSLVYGPGNCTIPLMPGWDYIFYLNGEHNFVSFPTGSMGFIDLESQAAKEALAEVRALAKQD
jgi:hypothetical protein